MVAIGSIVLGRKILKIYHPPFYMFSNSGHLGRLAEIHDTIFEGDHPTTMPPRFSSNLLSGFRGEDFFVIIDEQTTDAK